jgi:ABC-type antimicrobial peptide transport system permease subunit
MQETVRFNDQVPEFDESFPFVAVPEEGFKYYEPIKGLTGKIDDGCIVVDDKTAEKYKIKEGDTVKLTFNPTGVVPIIREYKLVSVLKPDAFKTSGTVFMSERDYKELFKDSPGYCLIKCEKPDYVARMIKTYAVGSYSEVQTHKEMMAELNKRNAKLNTVLIAIIAIAVGMTFIGMASNQLIGFEGRKKECAVLLSTSMDKKRLSGVLFCEMLITALTASVMGTTVGVILTGIINKLLAKSSTLEIKVEASPIATLLFCVFLIFAFTATVLFPIRNLKKMKIAEQIKYE